MFYGDDTMGKYGQVTVKAAKYVQHGYEPKHI